MANSKRYNQETKEKQKLVSEESPLRSQQGDVRRSVAQLKKKI